MVFLLLPCKVAVLFICFRPFPRHVTFGNLRFLISHSRDLCTPPPHPPPPAAAFSRTAIITSSWQADFLFPESVVGPWWLPSTAVKSLQHVLLSLHVFVSCLGPKTCPQALGEGASLRSPPAERPEAAPSHLETAGLGTTPSPPGRPRLVLCA